MVELLTHESFEPHTGTAFSISMHGHSDELTLADVQVQAGLKGFERRPFTLIFKGTRNDAVFDGHIYPLEHPAMGTIEIFLAPMARNQDGTFQYQAVFN